jgi:hypothetical protein
MKKTLLSIGALGLIIGVLGLTMLVNLAGEQPATVKPLISKLKAEAKPVTIGLGSNHGVNTGDVFDVYRENKNIGEITIADIEPDQSAANVTKLLGVQELKTGDSVIRDVTLQFLRRLRPDSALPTPAQSGRTFAEADIKSGINRILYYGPPWSAGKPLIDDDTGYPVHITAGCIVTTDFRLLVDEYNLTMRKHFQAR